MPKIALIGAGVVGFPQTLIRDILSFESLREGHFSLMDVDPERMDVTYQWAQKLLAQESLPTTVSQTVDRAEALDDADYVICVGCGHLVPRDNMVERDAEATPYESVDVDDVEGVTECRVRTVRV